MSTFASISKILIITTIASHLDHILPPSTSKAIRYHMYTPIQAIMIFIAGGSTQASSMLSTLSVMPALGLLPVSQREATS